MQLNSFEGACDRLSHAVDAIQFERLRWARTEGPMLARLVTLVQAVVEPRPDIELVDEGSTSATRCFVLKVHGKRIVRIDMGLNAGHAVVTAQEIDRSPYRLAPGDPVSADFQQVDEAWMAGALEQMFSRIRS